MQIQLGFFLLSARICKVVLDSISSQVHPGKGHNSLVLRYFFLFVSLLLTRNIRKYVKCFPRDVMILQGGGGGVGNLTLSFTDV